MWLRTGSYFYCTHLEYSTTAGLDRRSHHLHTAVGGKLLAPVTTTTYTDKIYPKEHEQLLDDKMLLAPDLIDLLIACSNMASISRISFYRKFDFVTPLRCH